MRWRLGDKDSLTDCDSFVAGVAKSSERDNVRSASEHPSLFLIG